MRLTLAAPGDPFDPLTWSGASSRLARALERRGCAVSGVDIDPGRVDDVLARMTTVHRDREVWKARYELSGVGRAAATARGALGVRRAGPADAVLQIGAWANLTHTPGVSPRVRCSYHDGNLAVYLRRPDSILDPASPQVRRRLAYERRVYDGLDLIFPMSDWLRRSFVEDFGQDPAKVVTVGGGPNLDELPPPVERAAEPPPRVLFVGKDFARKGGHVLLRAWERVHAQRPDAELTIIGPPDPVDGPGVRYLEPIDRSSATGDAALERHYREASVFVLPSLYEPFGIAFLEAMAHGLPAVATSTCAMREIVEDGVSGAIAEPGDADGLADRLLELLADPARTRAMGEAARRRVHERFTWDAVAGRMHDAIASRAAA